MVEEKYIKAGLTEEKHHKLKEICKEKKLILTSVFNINDLPFVSSINPEIVKIPSHEIHNLPLIEVNYLKSLVSTGAAKWSEVESTLKYKTMINLY